MLGLAKYIICLNEHIFQILLINSLITYSQTIPTKSQPLEVRTLCPHRFNEMLDIGDIDKHAGSRLLYLGTHGLQVVE